MLFRSTSGSGLWFIRKTSTDAMNLVLFGAYKSAAKTSTLATGWNLVGNSSDAEVEIKDGTKGDIIRKVVNGEIREYTKKAAGWKYWSYANGTGSWVVENLKVAPGEGIWYNAQSAGSITWKAADAQ